MVIKKIEKTRNEDTRAGAGVANISAEIREAILRCFKDAWRKRLNNIM